MGNKTRFSIAKKDIIHYFNESGKKVFSKNDIGTVLGENRQFWRLTDSLTIAGFIELLLNSTDLITHKIKFNSHTSILYSWGQIDINDLALSLNAKGYISHYSAIYYLGLTEQIPKTIYITVEQSKKKDKNSKALKQLQIDNAFAKPTRLSNNYALYNDQKICLLNGMHTDLLGVEINSEKNVRVTNIERTLIDITIRPEYSGGIYEVLKAYDNASQDVSINKLVSYLKKFNYIYPFHQCVGFYMMATGKYSDSQLQLLRKMEMPLKFYLTHGIEKKVFSKEWNLYYPANFQF
jgi:predicted transcriptional regulator of viral defense system